MGFMETWFEEEFARAGDGVADRGSSWETETENKNEMRAGVGRLWVASGSERGMGEGRDLWMIEYRDRDVIGETIWTWSQNGARAVGRW